MEDSIARALLWVEQIRAVGLNAAYVSIEYCYREELRRALELAGITVKDAVWNYPQGVYVGQDPNPQPLSVFSLTWG